MKRSRLFSMLLVALLSISVAVPLVHAQIEAITIPAGTPEDQALQAITKEPDDQKKLTMYADFLTQFSSNPAAVAYGNWQVAQYYQGAGDLPKALEYGDKASGQRAPQPRYSRLPGQHCPADEEQQQTARLLGARR